jgi:4-amino-4-deoxy-L-arabinose transferase-like glycosyltransferase
MPRAGRRAGWRWSLQAGLTRLSRPRPAAVAIFILALAVRVTYNLTIATNYTPTSDAHEYDQLARNLLQWHCYCIFAPGHATTYRPPVFPLFLAGVYLLSGAHPLAGRLALSVVGAVTCMLVCVMARDLFGRRTGLLAGVIAATYPQLFVYDA